jgi:hypothetical protein
MKEIEDLLFDWIDTDLAELRAYRSVSTCAPTQNGENYAVLHEAHEAYRRAYDALANLAKLTGSTPLQELFDDYTAFKERHGLQVDPKDIPALFSQELAELRYHHAVALLALQEAHARQLDETTSARCATSSGPGSSPGG